MTTVMVNISVSDFKSWKLKYDAVKPQVSSFYELAVAESSNKPGSVYLLYQTHSPEVHNDIKDDPQMQAMIQKAMDETGVISINEVTFFH
jgi:heat shock protein HspQ